MKLWLLERIGGGDYDEAYGFVVRAESEDAARRSLVDGKKYGDEGPVTWMDSAQTSCSELTPEGSPEVILRDFNAG